MKKKNLFSLVLLFASFAATAQEVENEKQPANVYFNNGKLTLESDNKAFKLWFDNRVYIDAAYYSPSDDINGLSSKLNKDLPTDDGQFRFNNGAIIRRARLGIKGTLYNKWNAELDLDFAYNEVEIKDMYLGYKFNDHLSIKAGNFKEPMSMERLTSSKYLINMERPMPVEMFAGGRKLGIAATAWNKHWWVSGGVFGSEVSILQKEKNRGSDGYGFTARAAVSPILRNDMVLHVGAYGTYRTPEASGQENRFVEFRTFPESRVDRRRFVRTEVPNVNHYTTTGIELAYKYQKLLVYGEYIFTDLSRYKLEGDRKVNLKNATFDGWYATASYMLIGKQREYASDDAEFGPMAINKKGGNLEIAGRISTVNLNDFHDASAVITGGQASSYAASLNWYPNRNILIGLNYTYMNNDKYADDKGHITMEGKPLKDAFKSGVDFSVFQMRLLVSF